MTLAIVTDDADLPDPVAISMVVATKDRTADVMAHLPLWLTSDVDEVILVAWACPDEIGKHVFSSAWGRHPKLRMVWISPGAAGPDFNLGLARNLGAGVARHEWLLFGNVDQRFTPRFTSQLRNRAMLGADMVLAGRHCRDPLRLGCLPPGWEVDGTCLIRNSLFYTINGYNETEPGWGGESYDLYLRADACLRGRHGRGVVGYFDPEQVTTRAHGDELRHRHSLRRFMEREEEFLRRMEMFTAARKAHHRSQPGRMLGMNLHNIGEPMEFVSLGVRHTYTPGMDI